MARKQNLRLLSRVYKRYPYDSGECVYCGAYPNTIDHVPPLKVVAGLPFDSLAREGVPLWFVPCCSECNIALGGKALMTVVERREFIQETLRSAQVSTPAWTDEELEDLGPGLRSMIQNRIERRRID